MSDIRCPMCGKSNPAEAETCWNCQARLKPLLPPQPSSPGEETGPSDWLSGLRDSSSDESGWQGPEPAKDEPGGEPPDWLARIRAQHQADQQAEDEGDDWLKMISGSGEETPAAAEPSPAGSPENGWPESPHDEQPPEHPETPGSEEQETGDWLAGLSGWGALAESGGEPENTPEAGADDMSWLNDFQTLPETPFETFAGTSGPGATAGGGTPLAAESPSEPAEQAEEPGEATSPFEMSTGEGGEDWLSQLPSQQTDEAAYSSTDGELSDWFSGLNLEGDATASPADQAAQPEQPFETPFNAGPSASSPFTESEPEAEAVETPDWLKVFGSAEPGEPPANPPTEPEEGAAAVLPFAGADMPDWLASSEEHPKTEKNPEESKPEELEAAQLPGWLQAMRPVEAVVLQKTPGRAQDETIERAGPLAGMVGVVPGEEIVNQVRRPPVYSSRLHVNESQRIQAALLEEMLSEESRPRPARAGRSHVPQRIVRLMIALLLLAVVALPLVSGTTMMPLPDLFPPETVSFRGLVEALPERAPVLLAVDYDPGLSEEMALASSSVLDHLMAKNARLTTLSTTPYGPVLADSLLNSASGRNSAYPLVENSVNLGFLPGGTAGLQEFASRPQVAMQYGFNGQPAWETPALQGVTDMRKFSLVIVLTENAETARAWIEQVQPRLGEVPLLFVISAQSAPFIHPYIDSGQVKGMVSGLSGGAAYAQIARQPAAAAPYWDAYQFGLFAAIALILVGGLWSLIRSLAARKPAQKGA